MDKAKLVSFRGKQIADMSRDELLAVVDYLGRRLYESNSPENREAFAIGQVEMIKRRVWGKP